MKRLLALPVAFFLVAMLASPALAANELSISASGGSLYFPGENAVVYFTTTADGTLVNPDTTTVTLYLPSNANSFALTPVSVSTGVFYVNYTLPATALTGFYAVVITASYLSGAYVGTVTSGFEVSQGLISQQNSILAAIGNLGSQLSTAESNILLAIGALNSSLNSAIASVGASVSSMGANLQAAITASQTAMAASVSQGTSAVQGAVSSAQSAVTSAMNSTSGSFSSSLDSYFNNINNYEYYILALTAVVLIVTIVILAARRK